MNKEELNCYHKIWSIIHKTDLLNFDEKDELHLFLMKFKDENKELHNKIDKYKSLEQRLTFIKNRVKQGMTQENVNKCAIQLVNSYLKDSDVDE